ncbi:hypothetical protein CQA49_07875 [Helicobacter sp. MIT 00-7814]|uniref:haloacid dehalogenase-like hydrolase n=1 Tax=unclassified Helicobacter TaxID=2593540 RepID=UPI000E1ECE21|nr:MULTISPECIES: haloacid dehalogenase-like hydrolase [unclassified Helicobacter]RDU52478.1 hypothetical protein CQA37_08535 [Helicobacter sp. MIT 99-10781]RDU52787.1 hypothetical protein CQA49_07875 [Helicobacter sp. MIT 00-7814]
MRVVFDICGTLYDSNTTLDFCQWRAKGAQKYYLSFLRSKFTRALNKFSKKCLKKEIIPVREIFIKTLKGESKDSLYSQGVKFVSIFLVRKKRKEVIELLQKFSTSDVVLVSATIDCVAYAIAQKLRIDKFYSSSLKYDKNGLCVGVLENDLLGKKHNLFQEIDFIATDNLSDIELCKKAKEALIISYPRHKKFWLSQNLKNIQIIEV